MSYLLLCRDRCSIKWRAEQTHDMGTCVVQTTAEGCSISFTALQFPVLILGNGHQLGFCASPSYERRELMVLGETCMVNGMQAKVNACFPLEVLHFLLHLLKDLIQTTLKSAKICGTPLLTPGRFGSAPGALLLWEFLPCLLRQRG